MSVSVSLQIPAQLVLQLHVHVFAVKIATMCVYVCVLSYVPLFCVIIYLSCLSV